MVIPAGPPLTPPELAADSLVMADGARLPLHAWLPEAPPRAVILAVHGFGDTARNAFRMAAPMLTADGVALYAYDQRGFGEAPNWPLWPGAETLKAEELTDPATSLETLAWRLFHEDEVRIEAGDVVSRGCRCSVDYFAGVLSKFPEAERGEMADEAGLINVDCAFCSRVFPITLEEIAAHG